MSRRQAQWDRISSPLGSVVEHASSALLRGSGAWRSGSRVVLPRLIADKSDSERAREDAADASGLVGFSLRHISTPFAPLVAAVVRDNIMSLLTLGGVRRLSN